MGDNLPVGNYIFSDSSFSIYTMEETKNELITPRNILLEGENIIQISVEKDNNITMSFKSIPLDKKFSCFYSANSGVVLAYMWLVENEMAIKDPYILFFKGGKFYYEGRQYSLQGRKKGESGLGVR